MIKKLFLEKLFLKKVVDKLRNFKKLKKLMFMGIIKRFLINKEILK